MSSKTLPRIMSSIQYISDLHLERSFKRSIRATKPYLILAGDIGYPKEDSYKEFMLDMASSFDKVFIVSGNHEYDHSKPSNYKEIDSRIEDICQMRNNLFFLQKKTYKLCTLDNISLAGCTMWSRKPVSKIQYHYDHVKWLKNTLSDNSNDNYVVVTHHPPIYECINKKYPSRTMDYFGSDQVYLLEKNNVITWIYGHTHYNNSMFRYGKWLLTNQYGNYENPLQKFKN